MFSFVAYNKAINVMYSVKNPRACCRSRVRVKNAKDLHSRMSLIGRRDETSTSSPASSPTHTGARKAHAKRRRIRKPGKIKLSAANTSNKSYTVIAFHTAVELSPRKAAACAVINGALCNKWPRCRGAIYFHLEGVPWGGGAAGGRRQGREVGKRGEGGARAGVREVGKERKQGEAGRDKGEGRAGKKGNLGGRRERWRGREEARSEKADRKRRVGRLGKECKGRESQLRVREEARTL